MQTIRAISILLVPAFHPRSLPISRLRFNGGFDRNAGGSGRCGIGGHF